MRREAAIIERAGASAVIGCAAFGQVVDSAAGVVSFGVCGGLDPTLEAGTLILGTEVVDRDGRRLHADPVWLERLGDALPAAIAAPIAGADAIVATVAAKAELRRVTGAAATDTESAFAVRLAHARGLPFAAVRAVCDDAASDLPPAALVGLRPDGREDFAAVLRAVAGNPGQLGALVRLARDAATALTTLTRCVERVVVLTRP